MSALDSAALFADRAKAFGLSESVLEKLKDANLNTFGTLAFASPYQPGQADETPLLRAFEAALGRSPTTQETPPLRRLFFEAHTMVLSDLRTRVERTEGAPARKLPMAERSERLELQKQRLPGVVVTMDLEPSHHLVDKVFQQLEDGCVSWLPWNTLSSRAHESASVKQAYQLTFDASGNVKASKKEDDAVISLTGDIRVRQALTRRALAYDLAHLVDFTDLESWSEHLFACMLRTPPPGFQHTSMSQVQEADKKLWQLVSERTRGAVAQRADGTKPAGQAIKALLDSVEVRYLLQPLPKQPVQSVRDPPKVLKDKLKDRNKDKDLKQKGGHKGDGKGFDTLPPDCVSHTPEGKVLCRNWNKNKCTFAKGGKRCKYGHHLCWREGCHRPKPFTECTHE